MTLAPPPLSAADPASWIEQHHSAHFRHLAELRATGAASQLHQYSLTDLLDGGRGVLRSRYEGELVEGWATQAALTGVVGAYAGIVAGFVAFATVASGAHWLVSSEQLRWLVDGDGWPVAITLGDPDVVVAPEHPWAGLPGVRVDADDVGRAAACRDALVGAVQPIVDQAGTIARVGRAGLWNATADSMGHALMYQDAFPSEARHVEVVRRLVEPAGRPWRAHPLVRSVTTEYGEVCIAQRGGCCLVYTANAHGEADHDDEHDEHEHDEMHARFYELFVDPPDAPGYCNDCSLRADHDCISRLVWWRTEELKSRRADPVS